MSSSRRVLAVIGALALSLFVFSESAPGGRSRVQRDGRRCRCVARDPAAGRRRLRECRLPRASRRPTRCSRSRSRRRPARRGARARRSPRSARCTRAAAPGRRRSTRWTTMPRPSPPPAAAAKLIVADAVPLGLDPAAFDPGDDGSPVNSSRCSMRDGPLRVRREQPRASARSATRCSRSWRSGSSVVLRLRPRSATVRARAAGRRRVGLHRRSRPASGADPDVIGLALMALVGRWRPGRPIPPSRQALELLATSQQSSGAWIDFFGTEGNASSTALAVLGITASRVRRVVVVLARHRRRPSTASTVVREPDRVDSLAAAARRSHREPVRHVRCQHLHDVAGGRRNSAVVVADRAMRRPRPASCRHRPRATSTPTAGSSITISGDGFAPEHHAHDRAAQHADRARDHADRRAPATTR